MNPHSSESPASCAAPGKSKTRSFRRTTVAALLALVVLALLGSTGRARRWCWQFWNGSPTKATVLPSPRKPRKPAPALIHYLGRFDTRDPSGPRFSWPGSAIVATFEGTGLDAKIKDEGTNFFSLVLDGGPALTLSTSRAREDYELASGLLPGRHTVVVTKRTEATVGTVQLLALAARDGALVPTTEPFTRRIEYVGDSITCGYGNLGANATCPFTPATEDETLAYGAIAGRELGAEVRAIAYSGIGIYRNYEGSTVDQMPVLFERTLAKETGRWLFETPEPDVVVINLGANDFAKGDPGEPFARAYVAFLGQLRDHYPSAHVICALSPMVYDAPPEHRERTIVAAVLHKAVSDRAAAGDKRIHYFEFEPPKPGEGFGCDFHPSLLTHRTMATALVAEIRALTGW